MRSQDLKLAFIFHLDIANCLLELFANVKCSTDLTTVDSVWWVQPISTWNFCQQWDHQSCFRTPC